MSRGGYRKGAGRKPKWKNLDTVTIRVPQVIADQVLTFAHFIDNLEKPLRESLLEKITKSKFSFEKITESNTDLNKVINLNGVAISRIHGKTLVFLSDLDRAGYTIEPLVLRNVVRSEES